MKNNICKKQELFEMPKNSLSSLSMEIIKWHSTELSWKESSTKEEKIAWHSTCGARGEL